MNMDETWLHIDPTTSRNKLYVVPSRLKRAEIDTTAGSSHHYTLIFTIFANGGCGPVVWIKSGGKPRQSTVEAMSTGKTKDALILGSSTTRS